jgi:hypothetical protein
MAWVVPAIAAELWNVSVQHIMDCIREGRVPSRSENGFVFVNVAPHSDSITPPRLRPEDRPPTFVMADREKPAEIAPDDSLSAEELEELRQPLETDESAGLSMVHHRRHEVSRLRTPPRRVA